jgi:hypothetical protein
LCYLERALGPEGDDMKTCRLTLRHFLALSLLASIAGCPPSTTRDDDDDDGRDGGLPGWDSGPCIDPSTEDCNNGDDDDCDGFRDCEDDDCHQDDACLVPGCGELQTPEASLALPDGDCPEDETEPCEGYEAPITFTGFTDGQELEDISALLGICVNIEHSWMRDLVIYAECPSGTRVMLSDFMGRSGGEVFLGVPDDTDDYDPEPGEGWDYCWTPSANNEPWIPYADAHGDLFGWTLPAGDYQSSESLDAFVGCPLNGDWTIRVEDRWGIDNGFIFKFWVKFDPNIVDDCSSWFG